MTRELTVGQTIGLGLQLLLTVVTEPMTLAMEASIETTPVTIERRSPADEARDYCVRQPQVVREEVVYEQTVSDRVEAPILPDGVLEVVEHSPDIVEELPEMGEKADPEVLTELVVDPPDALAHLREEILAREAASLAVERHLSEQIRERRANELPEGPERDEFRKASLASQAGREENIRKEYAAELQMVDAAREVIAPPVFTPKEL